MTKNTKLVIMLLTLALALVIPAMASAGGNSDADISVSFGSNNTSATINSSKGVSNYTVTLCSGALPKVEMSGDDHSVTVGPYGEAIVSVTVKSGTTTKTVSSGANCSPPPCQADDCNEIPEVPSHLAVLFGLALLVPGAMYIRRRRQQA